MKIQLRHDAAAAWTAANPVLADGEFGVEDDTGLFKIGRGGATWTDLLYPVGGSGMSQTDADARYVQLSTLATVATTGAYGDLSGLPVLGTAAAMASTAFATAAQGALAGTAVQPGSLAAVATTGAYGDLTGQPLVPTDNSQLTNGAGYVTTDTTYGLATTTAAGLMSAADKTKLDGLGGGGNYTLPTASDTVLGGVKIGANVTITSGVISVAAPVTDNSGLTNGAGYITAASLSGYALTSQLFSGSYLDLTNKPTIPASQVNADWNAGTGVAQILNKPALFSGAYADLSGKPTLGTAAATDATAYATSAQGAKADAAWPAASLTGATKIAVVATLPGTPDASTLYFTTT